MPITTAEAQNVTRAFVRSYPGALELAYFFREDAAELYGPRAAEVPQDMKGGYVPKETMHAGRAYRGRVDVPLANVDSAGDLLLTLRHEVLGHYGANTFTPAEKRALLDGLVAAREEPSLKPLWNDVDRWYADSPLDVRAEEVFALSAEGIEPRHHQTNDQVSKKGQQSFSETCIARARPMQAGDLHNIACMVAQGLHDRSRTQLNFPQINQLFRRNEKMESKPPMAPKKPFHETVAETLIEQLKAGTAPWQRPWQAGEPGTFLPTNPTTGKRYKGINAMFLMSQGHTDQRWMTYKQATATGAQVRKGEKGTPIQYWKFSEEHGKTDDAGRPVLDASGEQVKVSVKLERPRVFFATVFNAEQIDGLPAALPRKVHEWNPIERAEQILQASGAKITHSQQPRAFYSTVTDGVHMPDKAMFPTADGYYAVAMHELGHWTGHESRLDRDLGHPFGSEAYAKEELRAEIASMILGDEIGIGHDPEQHVAYVASWIKVLQDDPLEIFRAAADAEKIQDFILTLELQHRQKQEAEQSQEKIPQLMTFNEFVQVAKVIPLENHGQRWEVVVGEKSYGFSDAESPEGAFLEVHRREVNNALWSQSAANPPGGMPVEAMPTDRVLDEYPDLKIKFADVLERVAQEKNMQAPPTAPAAGRLVDRLTESGMPRDEAVVAAAWRDLHVATAATLPLATEDFQEAATKAFGFTLPADWNGLIQVQGNVTQIVDGVEHVTSAESIGAKPEFWGVYAQHESGMHQFLADAPTQQEAEALSLRLARVDAHAEINKFDEALKLARINERVVRADPNSTDVQISAAKENRKDAESAALLNDPEFQRQSAEFEQQEKARRAEQSQAPTPEGSSQSGKVFLNVPFKEKNAAKALGAKWDRTEQAWYVPAGLDAAPFEAWKIAPSEAASALPATQALPESNKPAQERIYLAVPYEDRNEAKAAGAAWDKPAKSWYAGPNADMARLERWQLNNVQDQQGPAMTPKEEFAQALESYGCVVSAPHPIMDGKKHRISVVGDKHSEKAGAGFYVAHLDGHPAGFIQNNKTGVSGNWSAKGYNLDPEDRAQMLANAAGKLEARAAEQAELHEQSAQRVSTQLSGLHPVMESTPYLQAKGIEPQPGAFTDSNGKTTYIPAIDTTGKQWSMQYIQEDGQKRFAKESRKEGCFHAVGGMEALSKAPALVIGEGYATACTLSESLGHATVSAFDSGNLIHVAKALQEKFPDKPIIIAGDNDLNQELTHGTNPGKTKGARAAEAVGGTFLMPIFAPGEQAYPAGLPPFTTEAWRLGQVSAEQVAGIEHMKKFTDFNDLATRSVLGKEGLDRQIRPIVEAAVQKHSARQAEQQQQEKKQEQTPAKPQRQRKAVSVS